VRLTLFIADHEGSAQKAEVNLPCRSVEFALASSVPIG